MKNVEAQLEKAFGLFDQGLLHEAEDKPPMIQMPFEK